MWNKEAERFWQRVEKSDECWLWTGARTSQGYGSLWFGKTQIYAHRFAYFLQHGEWPAETDHLCRTPPCVRPEHLESVTHAENMARARLTHCYKGHLYDEANTYWQAPGDRVCLTCKREREIVNGRAYRARKSARLISVGGTG